MEWKEVTLGDLCEISSSKRIFAKEYQPDGVPFYRGKEIIAKQKGNPISNELFISRNRYEEIKARYGVPQQRELLLTSVGTLGVPYVIKEEDFYFKDGNLTWFRHFNGLDVEYLYYWFLSPYGKNEINTKAIGSTQKALTIDSLSKFDIKIPANLDDQRRIASILSSLDRKIELNNKINADLEEMAQAIFKNWFVDFEPFKDGKFVDSELGMIPEGWKVGTLGDFCKCLLGGTPSRSKEEYWNGDVNWINSGEINKFRILEASEKITELGLSKSATKLLPKKTTVLAITGATLGQVSLLEIDTCANQSVIGVLENAEVPYEYIYPFIKDRIEMLIQHQTGGAQQHINKDNVESLIFLLPAKNVLENYISLVGPMYKRIESQCFENLYLSTLRDTLLPRLMSGELEVPE